MGLLPRNEKFFERFEELADKIMTGASLFVEILQDGEIAATKVAGLKRMEQEADTITHRIYEKMHRSFITPLDREDIQTLANKLDSILDLTEGTAQRMVLYKITKVQPALLEMAKILEKAVAEVRQCVYEVKDKNKGKDIVARCVTINTLENDGDSILRQAIASLFGEEKDPIEIIKWKEIYERLEEGIDMCEDVSNVIEGIVIKNG